jgi:hypothetical protein
LLAGTAVETKKAAAAAHAADLASLIRDIREAGATSLRDIVSELNAREVPAARGGTWSAAQVSRLLQGIQGSANGAGHWLELASAGHGTRHGTPHAPTAVKRVLDRRHPARWICTHRFFGREVVPLECVMHLA